MAKQMMVYAIKDGKGAYIDDVEKGLKCRCVCPACGSRLIAKKGERRQPHFAHENSECANGLETSLHLMAKDIISNAKSFLVPAVRLPSQPPNWDDFSPAQSIDIEKVEIEKHGDGMIPDLVLYPVSKSPSPKTLAIEIFVTHKTGEEKIKQFKSQKQAAIEIDLSNIDRTISYENLKQILLSETSNKSWLNNEKEHEFHAKMLRCCDELSCSAFNDRIRIDHCPINKCNYNGYSYAFLDNHCHSCQWYIGKTATAIHLCLGTMKIANNKELRQVKEQKIIDFEKTKKEPKVPIPRTCPKCGGFLEKKRGKIYSEMWVCNQYPLCTYTITENYPFSSNR